jgi:YidC/Oxa1 family membrane protein insertase
VKWTAIKNKYFSIILKPFPATKAQFYKETKDGSYVTGVETESITIQPEAQEEQKFVVYAGPSRIQDLKTAGYGFDEFLNYGFFDFIAKWMLSVMGFFYSLVNSWGVAIILLAVILNLILFPLSMQGFKSMKKMQELQPQIEKIKQASKGNAEKMNREVLALYKTNRVNPLSGCLPLLLQMPIFIALYQALIRAVELRGLGSYG